MAPQTIFYRAGAAESTNFDFKKIIMARKDPDPAKNVPYS
jgi:hypothetical protein